MGHPTLAYLSARRQTEPILRALNRVRDQDEIEKLIAQHKHGTPLIDYIQSIPNEGDVAMLEVKLADARTRRDELESKIKLIAKRVKSCGSAINGKAAQYRQDMHDTFEEFLDSQDVVTNIRDDLNLLKDILQA